MTDQSRMPLGESPPNGLTQETISDIVISDNVPRNHVDGDPSAADERKERIRVKNRRKTYLDSHPSYFESPDLEIVGI